MHSIESWAQHKLGMENASWNAEACDVTWGMLSQGSSNHIWGSACRFSPRPYFLTCASAVSHQAVACITTVGGCLFKRCSPSVTNLAISWASQSIYHSPQQLLRVEIYHVYVWYFKMMYTLCMCHVKISQEPKNPLELWHVLLSFGGMRGKGAQERSTASQGGNIPQSQTTNLHVWLHLSEFSLALSYSIHRQWNQGGIQGMCPTPWRDFAA